MNQNHWKALAILGGVALGFFYLAGYSTTATTFPGTSMLSVYNSGITTGQNY